MSSQGIVIVSNYLGVHRLQSYLSDTYGNLDQALELYKWNSEISAELFRILADVEIFLRNVIDRELQKLNVTLGNNSTWLDELVEFIPFAHHELIHNRDIARDYQICIEVLYAISPDIAAWSAENSGVPRVLAEKPR